MLKYSRVALTIPLKETTGREVTEHLGVSPTEIRESTGHSFKPGAGAKTTVHYTWLLDSPKDQNFDPTVRLDALLDAIVPFSERLISLDSKYSISLDSKYSRWIDLVFHVTPQREDGTITGEFDWFMMSPSLMSKMGTLNLLFSYEKFWHEEQFYKIRMESKSRTFSHPSLLQKLFGKKSNSTESPNI